jgi:hypothetical protein
MFKELINLEIINNELKKKNNKKFIKNILYNIFEDIFIVFIILIILQLVSLIINLGNYFLIISKINNLGIIYKNNA